MRVLPTRYFGRATGRHRALRLPGQLVDQQFVHCPTCNVETAAVQHGNRLRCTEGHFVPAGGAA